MSELARIEAKVDRLSDQIASLVAAQEKRDELLSDAGPILKDALGVATARLASAEEKGYFAMGRGLLDVVDRIVEAYGPEDIEALGDNVVAILDMIRALTQPDVTAVLSEIAEATEHPEDVKPVGLLGAARAAREEDAKRGIGVLVEVLRRLGKGVRRAGRRKTLERQLGSRRTTGAAAQRLPRPSRRSAPAPTIKAESAAPAPATPIPSSIAIDGVRLTDEGFLQDPADWSEQFADKMAAAIGIQLTDDHRRLIEKARDEFARTKASPNIRRLTLITGLSTKQLYQMFPKAPGKCAAMIAGLPKPVGCI